MAIVLPKRVSENIGRFTGRTWVLPKILEWWDQYDKQIFLLRGVAGTGKSMLMAWLTGSGLAPDDSVAANQLARVRSLVKASHFCQADSRNITPQAFAESMANQLTMNVEGFAAAFAACLAAAGIHITGTAQAGTAKAGSNVAGVSISYIKVPKLSGEDSFDRMFTEPLNKLYEGGYDKQILLLVDALDEAFGYTGDKNLSVLLSTLADLPKVRLLITTRDDQRVLVRFDVASLDLNTSPPEVDDVHAYVVQQLNSSLSLIQEKKRIDFAGRLSNRAHGVFLYAAMVLEELHRQAETNLPDLDTYPLPAGLSGLYRTFLNREIGTEDKGRRWHEIYKPLLGLIAVAQGEGLTSKQLTAILKQDLTAALEVCKQYLSGTLPEGPFRPFHESFSEFLLDDEENVRYHIEGPKMHGKIADHYLSKYRDEWSKCDDYGLTNLALHLYRAQESAEDGTSLYSLVVDQGWISARTRRGDPSPLLADLSLSIRAARDEVPPNVHIIAKCCLLYSRWMTTAPPIVVDVLAAAGQLDRAAFIADNISYPLDRCQAFCLLAKRNANLHPEVARDQLAEARRSASAVRGSYWTMANYWLCEAARTLGDSKTLRGSALSALCSAQLMVQRFLGDPPSGASWWKDEQVLLRETIAPDPDGLLLSQKPDCGRSDKWMERSHTLFWASMALREAGDKSGLERIRLLLAAVRRSGFNLELQAAAVAEDTAYLDSFLPWRMGKLPHGPGGILRGNLALALATAGRCSDVTLLLEQTRQYWNDPGAAFASDSAKRLAWAMAICGHVADAFSYIRSMPHPEERLRALYRVTKVLANSGNEHGLEAAADLAECLLAEDEAELKRIQSQLIAPVLPKLNKSQKNQVVVPQAQISDRWREFTPSDFWRLRSWASWILASTGRMDRALELAEAVCAEGINVSEGTSLARPTRSTEKLKEHVPTDVGPNPDELALAKAIANADADQLGEAQRTANSIASARHRARAKAAVALKLHSKEQAMELWLSALMDARSVGEGLVIEILDRGERLLGAPAVSRLFNKSQHLISREA